MLKSSSYYHNRSKSGVPASKTAIKSTGAVNKLTSQKSSEMTSERKQSKVKAKIPQKSLQYNFSFSAKKNLPLSQNKSFSRRDPGQPINKLLSAAERSYLRNKMNNKSADKAAKTNISNTSSISNTSAILNKSEINQAALIRNLILHPKRVGGLSKSPLKQSDNSKPISKSASKKKQIAKPADKTYTRVHGEKVKLEIPTNPLVKNKKIRDKSKQA